MYIIITNLYKFMIINMLLKIMLRMDWKKKLPIISLTVSGLKGLQVPKEKKKKKLYDRYIYQTVLIKT